MVATAGLSKSARRSRQSINRNLKSATVRKYIGDKEGKRHAIVNGVLMVHRGWGKDTDA
ncbi:phage NinH family protein [Escherichia coli]|uniref:phage NinH family protein n=1 Tax=Escherichia coli TaxID=562 RepID=UPI002238BD23|nr:phage NinH family protein [Escherichia coli]MCW7160573.1 phage NinH family protein [Escherichia coli]